MHRTVRLILGFWVPILLIGHGGGLPCCNDNGLGCRSDCDPLCDGSPGGTIEYDVVGNCGPSGHVTLSKGEDQCDLRIEGDNVGIVAMSGFAGSSIASGWTTTTPLQSCIARRINETRLHVTCTQLGLSCNAFFIRSDQQCAVDTCSIPLCLGGQTLALGENDCCPTCVATTSDSGVVPFDAALPDLDSGSDEPSWCEAARTEYLDHYASLSATWGVCVSDDDCRITDIENDCAHHCNVVLNEDIYEGDTCDGGDCTDLEELLDDSANERCDGCTSPSECPEAADGEARCIDQQCTWVTTP